MWRRVRLVSTDISEEHVASIISMERISKLGTTLAVIANVVPRLLGRKHFSRIVVLKKLNIYLRLVQIH
jgi:hypothetical protein